MESKNKQQVTPTISSSIQPERPQSKTKYKIYILLVCVLILSIFISGTNLLSAEKTKSPTQMNKPTITPILKHTPQISRWKTFTNLYGATFQYPPEWSFDSELLTKINTQVDIEDTAYGNKLCTGDCHSFNITFLVSDNPQDLSLTDFIKNDYTKNG